MEMGSSSISYENILCLADVSLEQHVKKVMIHSNEVK